MTDHAINLRLDVALLVGFPVLIALGCLAVQRAVDGFDNFVKFLRDWC